MRALKNIDVAFVCMNLPYTMTPEEAAEAVKAFHPKVVIPYHYGKSDLSAFQKGVEVQESKCVCWSGIRRGKGFSPIVGARHAVAPSVERLVVNYFLGGSAGFSFVRDFCRSFEQPSRRVHRAAARFPALPT